MRGGPDKQELAGERESLREQLFDLLDPVMTALGLLTAVLLLIEFTVDLSPRQAALVGQAQQVIWAIFVVEFAVQFILAPDKLRFLRGHWLGAISVALPALRVFRALRAARALRSLRLIRLIGGTNRAMKALREMLRGRQFGYLVALTLLVTAAGAGGAYVLERGQPDANIQTFGDALWWAACLVTTINNEKFAVSPEGRVLAVLMRIYAAAIFGLITANIASYFVGKRQEESAAAAASGAGGGARRGGGGIAAPARGGAPAVRAAGGADRRRAPRPAGVSARPAAGCGAGERGGGGRRRSSSGRSRRRSRWSPRRSARRWCWWPSCGACGCTCAT